MLADLAICKKIILGMASLKKHKNLGKQAGAKLGQAQPTSYQYKTKAALIVNLSVYMNVHINVHLNDNLNPHRIVQLDVHKIDHKRILSLTSICS